jgi:hypothetical protein
MTINKPLIFELVLGESFTFPVGILTQRPSPKNRLRFLAPSPFKKGQPLAQQDKFDQHHLGKRVSWSTCLKTRPCVLVEKSLNPV